MILTQHFSLPLLFPRAVFSNRNSRNGRNARQGSNHPSEVEIARRAVNRTVDHAVRQHKFARTSQDWAYKISQATTEIEKLTREAHVIQAYQQASIDSVRQASAAYDKILRDWRNTLAFAQEKQQQALAGGSQFESQDNLEEAFNNAVALNSRQPPNPFRLGATITTTQDTARQQAARLRANEKQVARLKEDENERVNKTLAELDGEEANRMEP